MASIVTHPEVISTGDKIRYNRSYIYKVSAIAAMGGLLFGFDLSIISGTVRFFSENFKLTEIGTGWAVGCINLGSALGALAAGKISDLIGRKQTLLICAFLFGLTGLGTGWAESFSVFILFRMLSGVAVGAAAMVCPMYIAEISPATLRGRLVAFYQLAITAGILLAYFSNYLLLNTGPNNWRWMFSAQTIPSLLFFFCLFTVSESPRWLIRKSRNAEAIVILEKIGGSDYATAESKIISGSFSREFKERIKDLFTRDMIPTLILGVTIAVFSQAVGQNSLFSYAPEIFKQAGISVDTAFLQSVMLGFVNFLFTLIAIATIDRFGRKKLLITGAILLFADAIVLAYCFYAALQGIWILLFVLAFIAIFAATLGPVTWVILSEIFPNRVRGNAMSLATLALWVANFFATASFPLIKAYAGLPATFAFHAIICLVYFLLIRKFVTETRGRSLEEIEKVLTR